MKRIFAALCLTALLVAGATGCTADRRAITDNNAVNPSRYSNGYYDTHYANGTRVADGAYEVVDGAGDVVRGTVSGVENATNRAVTGVERATYDVTHPNK